MKIETSKSKGQRSEGFILAALLKSGKTVLVPFGDNQRYDLVIDSGAKGFVRVQCKTGRLRGGAVVFNASSTHDHRNKKTRDYRGQADVFGVYCPDNDQIYIVPVSDVGTRIAHLRLTASKNNQLNKIRFADLYVLKMPP